MLFVKIMISLKLSDEKVKKSNRTQQNIFFTEKVKKSNRTQQNIFR